MTFIQFKEEGGLSCGTTLPNHRIGNGCKVLALTFMTSIEFSGRRAT